VTGVWPWDAIAAAVTVPFQRWPHPHAVVGMIDLIVGIGVAGLSVLTFRLARRSYSIYTAAVLVMSLLLIVPYLPLQDAPRRWMMAFPIFVAAGEFVPHRWTLWLVPLCIVLQAFLSMLFVKWLVVG
jgi:hypothetical protein